MTRRRSPCLILLSTILAWGAIAPPAPAASTPLDDPIPEQPVVSGLGLTLEQFAQFPRSEPVPPPTDPRLVRWARINYLGELPDRSGRLYVPDLNGRLYFMEHGTPHEYLDVRSTFPDFWSGRGLGSGFGFVAFHPDFGENGRFYTVHTEAGDALTTRTPDLPYPADARAQGVVTEWTADDPSAATFSGTHREVLRLGFESYSHGIQQISFNPTAQRHDADYGLLDVAVGDGGSGVTDDTPQTLSVPQGKILRIDPRGTNGSNGRYGIPSANPFVDEPGALGEIYAYGLRDPHRFSWDPAWPHRMFLGHMGEHAVESIVEVRAGDNFGWSEREGPFVFDKQDRCHLYTLPEDDARYGYTYPVAAYDHDPPPGLSCTADSGHAVIGGFVYRGRGVPELRGKYVFADNVTGRIFYTNVDEMRRGDQRATIHQFMLYDGTGRRVTMQDLTGDSRIDVRFGIDADGELYVLSKGDGKVYKITGLRQFAVCAVGRTRVSHVMDARNWAPITRSKWEFAGGQAIMTEPGIQRPGPRRPFEYAVLESGPPFGSVRIDGQVRIDTPAEVTSRDVVVVFGYRSDTQFYYAHLSSDNLSYPHNGIFVVNDADRLRIEDQWDGSRGAPPAIRDERWHRVRAVHCADSGEIAVYVDGSKTPLMTATDTTFGSGRVGFGSFDDAGRLRGVTVTGTAVRP